MNIKAIHISKQMDISLTNFRCYSKRTFHLPFGVNLIDGPSGKGKSTLLQAIKYGLFGTVKQVTSYGEKKTSVSIQYEGLELIRTNIPSRLVVKINGNMYEDDAAQEVIYKRFGKQFDITSYMVQKGTSQFFTLTGSEKLLLLEELALHGEESIQTTKQSIQSELKVVRDKLKDEQAQLTLLQQYTKRPVFQKRQTISSLSDVHQLILFCERLESTWRSEQETCQHFIQFTSTRMKQQQEQIKVYQQYLSKYNQWTNERDTLTKDQLGIVSYINTIDEEKFVSQAKLHHEHVAYQKAKQFLEERSLSYHQLFESESNLFRQEILQLEQQRMACSFDMEMLTSSKQRMEEEWKLHQSFLSFQTVQQEIQSKTVYYQETIHRETQSQEKEKLEIQSRIKSCLNEKALLELETERTMLTTQLSHWKRKKEIETKRSNDSYKDISTQLDATRQTIDKLVKKLGEMEQRKCILSCPGCKKGLFLKGTSLCTAEKNPITDEERKQETKYRDALPLYQKKELNQQRLAIEYESLSTELSQLPELLSESYCESRISECNQQIQETIEIRMMNQALELQLKQLKPVIVTYKPLLDEIERLTIQHSRMNKGEEFPASTREAILELQHQMEQAKQCQLANQRINELLSKKQLHTPELKYASFRKEIEALQQTLLSMPKGEECSIMEEIKQTIETISFKKRELERLNKRIEELNSLLASLTKVELDSTDYISIMNRSQQQLEHNSSMLEETIRKKNDYQMHQHDMKEYLEYKKKVEDMAEKEKRCMLYQVRMEQLETLAHHIVQAEGICLEKFITRVNTTMKWYLEQFFPDQTVTMELDSERECKNGKIRHEICVHVLHSHHPCDLKALSGGEYDRCALAFMLAINELSHSPCLFLDESISSLDMSLSEDVLEVIKTKQSELHKIVLLVSHQANTGFFDHVITI